MIKTQKKSILNVFYRQGRVFKKYKDSDKFFNMVREFGVSRSTTYFKINVMKQLDKYSKLEKLSLNIFKDFANTIKPGSHL